ncbi:hypothetical protein N9I00_01460 [bacterium]|nr:hypothetical protein [bacterium]
MSKKTCDSFFCSNQTPKKYRYCYGCAKNKGLVGGSNWLGWVVLIIILLTVFG